MTDERFQELMNGALDHPMIVFRISRVAMALHYVVQMTGEAGEKALEEYCAQREEQDRRRDV